MASDTGVNIMVGLLAFIFVVTFSSCCFLLHMHYVKRHRLVVVSLEPRRRRGGTVNGDGTGGSEDHAEEMRNNRDVGNELGRTGGAVNDGGTGPDNLRCSAEPPVRS
ncbi:hypothetical protein CORC01_12028 [Colletotrichum orchidophilum]|uniref:Uncharacterized protein n=1 Tax=Colletotrichum orchidophilum TaxID=1209926 RepID=A0A1G4AU66_9PEZI|nr:uncharacterized protein CORC01_12028 [Colletotrichum orchidophilum]OHE92694.1 hypothetical protein CORC01_12028 [Colletotrichum orchidophilum]